MMLCKESLCFMFIIQAEGSEVSAELEFLNQQNLILSMENKALKQRLESLAQEQLIKYCKFQLMVVNFLVICPVFCFNSHVKLRIGFTDSLIVLFSRSSFKMVRWLIGLWLNLKEVVGKRIIYNVSRLM